VFSVVKSGSGEGEYNRLMPLAFLSLSWGLMRASFSPLLGSTT